MSPPRAWAEVDLGAIRHNFNLIRQASNGAGIMPVVKAGAYGHGLESIARCLDNEGIIFVGVANVGEARRISLCGCRTKPYILGPAFPEEREEIVLNSWRSFISTFDEAEHFNSLAALYGKTLPIHISVDTGMGRGGFLPDQLPELLGKIPTWQNLFIEGIGAHLPSADEDEELTKKQIAAFEAAVSTLTPCKTVRYRHLASSAGFLNYTVPSANLVRPGLILYGYSPVKNPIGDQLRPALVLKSRITVVRTLPAGHGVSYGQTYITQKPTQVATVGIGYADGYQRILARNGVQVYYQGQFCPVLGRITMDQIMIDVSKVSAQPGDEVEILGPHIPATKLAELAETIPWEILTSIGPRIPRIYSNH
ncbi:MAG: alanine racemase [Akkermansia sp.]